MGLRDRAVDYLRSIFSAEREERDKAISPSNEAEKHIPTSIYSVWGREDIGGLLSISQNLMDRYADYEAMMDYPDVACFSGDTLVYLLDNTIIKAVKISELAMDGGDYDILGYDRVKERLVKVRGLHPRLTGRNTTTVLLQFSNNQSLRVTPDHKILHASRGYVDARDLKKDDEILAVYPGFPVKGMGVLITTTPAVVKLTQDPTDAGTTDVFDITTDTYNLVANGIIAHNSANHYFANDATQPDIDTGRTIWVHSDNNAIKEMADFTIKKKLRLEDDIWSIAFSLVAYGNDFEEILVNENGVVGLNHLPVATVRRIDRPDGALLGFVQDVTGKFTEDAKNLRAYLAGSGQIPDHVAVFEDWQVCHMRLREMNRRSPYGRSVAHDARWIWKRLVLLEDAVMIYRLSRAPSRMAFYVDVTDIPSDKVESFLRRTKQEFKKKEFVNPRCLTAETCVTCLDGKDRSMKELVDEVPKLAAEGKHLYTFSYDLKRQKVVPGKITDAILSAKNVPVYRVVLDNGAIVRCTGDHPFLLRSGEYKHAKDLLNGETLMPVKDNSESRKILNSYLDGFEDVYDLTVEEYHNFSLTSGIFVHNTQKVDMRYNPLCLAGDTKIPLLDGSDKTVLDLIKDYESGQTNWVYSVDTSQNNKMVPGKIIWAGKTRENAKLVKVTFDNGESIRVTPDHKVLLRDGSPCEAQNLTPGTSVMPLYRSLSSKKKGDKINGYEQVYDPSTNRYVYTHRMVGEFLGMTDSTKGTVIHHKDFDKRNNSPQNLQEMLRSDHMALHAAAGHVGGEVTAKLRKEDKELDNKLRKIAAENITKYNKSPEKRKRTSELNRKYDTAKHIRAYNASEQHEQDNEIRRELKVAMWQDPERRKQAQERMTIKFSPEFMSTLEKLVQDNPKMGLENLAKIASTTEAIQILRKDNPTRKLKSIYADMITKAFRSVGWKDFADYRQSIGLTLKNHKVVSVEVLTEPEDTYCITVENTHNFGTTSGVVICNSSDEDIFLGVRDGKALSRVEVLNGPNYTYMDDIEYFKRMLHGSLKVPRTYLGQDGPIPGRSILSNEDYRSARVTLGVQRELRNGIARILHVDQAARGINPKDHELDVYMTVPSGIYELAQMEIRNARADFANRVLPFVSMEWVRSKVFHFSDEEIKALDCQVKQEQEKQIEAQIKAQEKMAKFQMGPPGDQPLPTPESPEPLSPFVSDLPRTTLDWKRYDAAKKLEEAREKETQKRLGELEDRFALLLSKDKQFAKQLEERQKFFNEFKDASLIKKNGYLSTAPSGKHINRFQ